MSRLLAKTSLLWLLLLSPAAGAATLTLDPGVESSSFYVENFVPPNTFPGSGAPGPAPAVGSLQNPFAPFFPPFDSRLDYSLTDAGFDLGFVIGRIDNIDASAIVRADVYFSVDEDVPYAFAGGWAIADPVSGFTSFILRLHDRTDDVQLFSASYVGGDPNPVFDLDEPTSLGSVSGARSGVLQAGHEYYLRLDMTSVGTAFEPLGIAVTGDGQFVLALGPACGNGLDDDGDGLVDFGPDPGCDSASDADEKGPAFACDDGVDNDGDGLVDLDDPGCAGATSAAEDPACDDGVDNDGDGQIDGADAGCAEPSSLAEDPACDDGVDNDGDGLVDLADPGCAGAAATLENPACNDGVDNDGDGDVDFDGGLLALGYVVADPDSRCTSADGPDEKSSQCGLGAELVGVLPLLLAIRRRRLVRA